MSDVRTNFGRDVSSDVSMYFSSEDCSDVSIDVESDVGSWKWLERYALSP